MAGHRSRTLAHALLALTGAMSTAIALTGLNMAPAAARTAAPAPVTDPAQYVNPLIGTGSGGTVVGSVDTFPGPDMPFGMLQWSPDTPSRPAGGGYNYDDKSILGFSLTHASGAGCGAYGDVPILPTTGAIGSNPQAATEPFSHSAEQATAGAYQVDLGSPAIKSQIAVNDRAGLGTFTYPATTQANMLFKAGDSQAGNAAASAQVVGNDEVTGSATSGHFCGSPGTYTVYFAAKFNRPFSSSGTWTPGGVTAGARSAVTHGPQQAPRLRPASGTGTAGARPATERKGPQSRLEVPNSSGPATGAWVTFDTTSNPVVQMQVSISFVSAANAEANLQADNPGWNVGALASRARAAWDGLLGKISVGGGTPEQLTTFYTALYHSLLHPNLFNDANGDYIGFDGKVHQTAPGHAEYANFSGWDIYRSQVPLASLLDPQAMGDAMQSLLDNAAQGGWLPKWPLANDYTAVMNGDAADPILAGALAFGATGFDTRTALQDMIKGATQVPSSSQLGQGWYGERPQLGQYLKLGYVPNTSASSISQVTNGVSETLEYALADFAISRFAQDTGAGSTARTFLARSQNWTNLFNTGSGYIQPRDSNGQFPPGNPLTTGMGGFGQSGFQEGNAAQYTWMVPQNLHGLFSAMGGNAAVVKRLDQFFTQLNVGPNEPYMWSGNEPSLGTPWEYDYAGAPYKAQQVVREIMTQLYGNSPGGMPGNDDLGAMSSWYVWAALGMYPLTPGVPELTLGSPLFPHAAVTLPNGHVLSINAPQASAGTPYVQALSLNGHAWPKTWLPASAIRSGGTLSYTLASTPDPSWAAAAQDAPHSYPAGPLSFPPPLVPAEVTSSPSSIEVAAGSQASATVTFHAGTGAGGQSPPGPAIGSLTWTAKPPPGVTLSPSSGTLTLGPDQTATTTVTASAASGMKQGFYTVPVTLSSNPAEPLPAAQLNVAVTGTGNTAHVCTTLGSTNTVNGLTQVDQADGVTAPMQAGGLPGRAMVKGADRNDWRYMYFNVDDRVAYDGSFQAVITVTYLDQGTSSFSLQYDSANPNGGPGQGAYTTAGPVQRTGTGTWKTATITVPDARFANRENGGTDFRLVSNGPGDPYAVTVHSAAVSVSGPGVIPVDLCPGS